MTAIDDARLLIREIQEALARGTKHYDLAGQPLLTVKAVIEALDRDGQIVFEPSKGAS